MNNLFVVWNSNGVTGVPIIDEHHRSVIATMNSLFYFMRTKQGVAAVLPTVTILEQYVKLHFCTEEKLLKESNYKDLDGHADQHRLIIGKMAILAAKLRRSCDPEELMVFLKFWLQEHIEIQDRAYSDHLTTYMHGKMNTAPAHSLPC